MTYPMRTGAVLYILLGVLLTACGGGGGTTTAGIGGTGITSSGTITGFGSIFVNGVEFETSTSVITLDDGPGSEFDLGLGMVVTVTGTLNADGVTGTASSVIFDDELQGPVASTPTDPTGDGNMLQFSVLGSTVLADRTGTVFAGGVAFDTLAQGDYIEVSGFHDQNGVLRATRIEGKGTFVSGASEVELKGVAQTATATTFTLGSFTVDYSSADVTGLTGGVVSNGMPVEVKGTLAGASIAATRVHDNDDGPGDDVDKASVEGIITDFVSISDFRVAGVQVDAGAATLVPASLVPANGTEVEVEGPIVGGVLQAIRVEARAGNVELEARVLSTSTVNGSITLQYAAGTVTVLVDSRTSLRDDLGIFGAYTLANVNSGDFLEIRAELDGGGNIVATEIRRDNVNDDILQGPAGSCTGTDVTVLGVPFTLVNGFTSVANENNVDVYGNSTVSFCSDYTSRGVPAGMYIKVRDDAVANGIADEVELEN